MGMFSRAGIYFGLLVLWSANSWGDITSQTVRPQLNTDYTLLEDASLWQWDSEIAKEYQAIYNILLNVVNVPITQFDASGNNQTAVVGRTTSFQGGAIWSVAPHLQVGLDTGENIIQNAAGVSYAGASDVRFVAKYGIWGKANDFGITFAPEFYVPIPNSNTFISNQAFGYGGRLILEKVFSIFSIAANGGFISFNGASYQNINYSTQFPLGLAAKVAVSKKVSINLEGVTNVLGGATLTSGPGDLYIGTRIRLVPTAILNAGVSTSPIQTNGATSIRFLVGFDFLPKAKESPTPPPAPPAPAQSIEKVQKIETVRNCGPTSKKLTFVARKLTEAEKSNILLPYVSTPERKITTLDLGASSGLTPSQRTYSKDAQTVFAIDLDGLPDRDAVLAMESLVLKMKVNRLNTAQGEAPEIICLLKQKVCSGNLYSEELKNTFINARFFEGKESPNDFFMKENSATTGSDSWKISTFELSLPFSKLTENSTLGNPVQLLYGKSENGAKKRTLYFAVGGDLYVYKKVELNISLEAISCTDSAPQVSEEIKPGEIKSNESGAPTLKGSGKP